MQTIFIEATNIEAGGMNWGKFMIGRFDDEEWRRRTEIDAKPMLFSRGWGPEFLLVLDLQTGEAAMFKAGGYAPADLNKHQIWVCPMFEPFLAWLYTQDVTDLATLPKLVNLDAEGDLRGYRREGPKPAKKKRVAKTV